MIYRFKEYKEFENNVCLDHICWKFADGLDERVVRGALKWRQHDEQGIPAIVMAGNSESEAYRLHIEEDTIRIESDGAAGAFYAIQTLSCMSELGETRCCEIYDYPDMSCRGFYHDITRGKVPTLDTLKKLVDRAVQMKINMLQLYVEHTFEFKEYAFCNERLGYITKDEMMELDKYCHENFVELVPSLSTFGHLYHLLQDGGYQHLCELENYVPSQHHWIERMKHHTINPSLDESFDVIKSLIDQYMPVFTSDKFNICGDETFDLGKGVNDGADVGELYCNFVSKIINYVRSKGKKVMMWGDVILNHPEFIEKLPEDVIFLPWFYGKEPDPEMFVKFAQAKRPMISCPGTTTWSAFLGRTSVSDQNIAKMAELAYQYGAEGLLNTNWGDFGNPCSIELAWYGMLCGAAISWDRTVVFDDAFHREASRILYGDERVIDLLSEIADMHSGMAWHDLVWYISEKEYGHPITLIHREQEKYQEMLDRSIQIRDELLTCDIKGTDVKEEIISACEIQALMEKWVAASHGMTVECPIDYRTWAEQYRALWLKKNKQSELDDMIWFCDSMENLLI